MSKVWNYIFLTIGMDLLFNLAGLHTAGSFITDQIGIATSLAGFSSSSWFIQWTLGLLVMFGITGIVVGSLLRIVDIGTVANALSISLYSMPLALFILDWVSISNAATAQDPITGTVIFLLFAPFVVAYAFSLWEWIIGRDV